MNTYVKGEPITLEPKRFIDQLVESKSVQNNLQRYNATVTTADNDYFGKISMAPALIGMCLRNFMNNSLEAIETTGKKENIEVGVKRKNGNLELYVQVCGES